MAPRIFYNILSLFLYSICKIITPCYLLRFESFFSSILPFFIRFDWIEGRRTKGTSNFDKDIIIRWIRLNARIHNTIDFSLLSSLALTTVSQKDGLAQWTMKFHVKQHQLLRSMPKHFQFAFGYKTNFEMEMIMFCNYFLAHNEYFPLKQLNAFMFVELLNWNLNKCSNFNIFFVRCSANWRDSNMKLNLMSYDI